MTVSLSDTYAIETKDLNVYYGGFRAVRDINLAIEPRQITALIGPSGCAKARCCVRSTA